VLGQAGHAGRSAEEHVRHVGAQRSRWPVEQLLAYTPLKRFEIPLARYL
jgi:hypothetical protein